MAAIEKICEFSGEYVGGEMWNHKRNHLQILPKHRKEFRGKQHILRFFKPDLVIRVKTGYVYLVSEEVHVRNEYPGSYSDYIKSELAYYNNRNRKGVLAHEYQYVLEVPDVPGEVDGEYSGYTYNKKLLKKRLKRMLRCRNLVVKYHDCYAYEFYTGETE